jgi:hypothetical protein
MQQGQLNCADLNGPLAVLCGPLFGVLCAKGRGAAWPLVVLVAILGIGIGIASARLLGRLAYACLDWKRSDVVALFGYMLLSLAMPLTSTSVSWALTEIIVARVPAG